MQLTIISQLVACIDIKWLNGHADLFPLEIITFYLPPKDKGKMK